MADAHIIRMLRLGRGARRQKWISLSASRPLRRIDEVGQRYRFCEDGVSHRGSSAVGGMLAEAGSAPIRGPRPAEAVQTVVARRSWGALAGSGMAPRGRGWAFDCSRSRRPPSDPQRRESSNHACGGE